MAEGHRVHFDPRGEYWRLPERRLCVAYLADRWTGHFAPAPALRDFSRRLLAHFDQARGDRLVTYKGVNYDEAGGLDKICAALIEHARRLPPILEWERLHKVWPKVADTAADDVIGFLIGVSSTDNWEPAFNRRLPWFGYLGVNSGEQLREHQAFFFGYSNLWTATNAYRYGGAQSFAPVIQNTASDIMLDAALDWATGARRMSTFTTLGKTDRDEAPQDRSQLAPVIEVYGFLNLERQPYYNNRADVYRKWFRIAGEVSAYDLTSGIGTITTDWLKDHQNATESLARLFRDRIVQPARSPISFEAIDSPPVRRRLGQEALELLDSELSTELESSAKHELMKLNEADSAAVMLHLILDGRAFLETEEPRTPAPPNDAAGPVKQTEQSEQRSLPGSLRPYGERALQYLKAGFHVLFAGAPGTGKTTLAQFVGYAWDSRLDTVPDKMPLSAAPLTTVGNSAWSPFHTVGGVVPTETGEFKPHAGIFIDPESTNSDAWKLHHGAIVLDEMNRADLDRCIGELYPLLSGSVSSVAPAGLLGVGRIDASPTFRVLATVNDARLDDIVFPISEGLARRFVRIELPGASLEEVLDFLGLDPTALGDQTRGEEAHESLQALFEAARDSKLLSPAEDDDRLPFGVAYFSLFRSWVQGQLQMPDGMGAKDLLAESLRTLGRSKAWSEALRAFVAKE